MRSVLQNQRFAFHHNHLPATKYPKGEINKGATFMFLERPIATMTQSNITGLVHIFPSLREDVISCFSQASIEMRIRLTQTYCYSHKVKLSSQPFDWNSSTNSSITYYIQNTAKALIQELDNCPYQIQLKSFQHISCCYVIAEEERV